MAASFLRYVAISMRMFAVIFLVAQAQEKTERMFNSKELNDMEEMSKTVRDYVMNDMVFKVDMPRLLKEIAECSKATPYPVTFTILARVLGILAERAIEINDPALNIIMLNLGLYEGAHDENVDDVISRLRKLITGNK